MKDLEIIVPVKNEADNLTQLTYRVKEALEPYQIDYGLIFIDDHSTDSTLQILANLSKNHPIRFYSKAGKVGKAYSILEGARYAEADNLAMIDGDLQYNPSAIPQMLQKLSNHGVVVGNRHHQTKSWVRKLTSKAFKFIFGKLLFGFNLDIQSGLKLFKKSIISHIDESEVSPWTIDLPLLYTAASLGHKIDTVDIGFYERNAGTTKVSLIKSSIELAVRALKLKFTGKQIYPLQPNFADSMLDAGIVYNNKKFITHTTLPHSLQAVKTLIRWQKLVFFLVIGALVTGFLLNVLFTIQMVIFLLSAVYFIDAIFSFFLVNKSLRHPPEISFSKTELSALNETNLPVYSILCPLYKETAVLPNFLQHLSKLNWPKDKLDVQLLLEEDDAETIQAVKSASLPSYIRLTIVPHSLPKTKPKACNFGLANVQGDYLAVYDAEDQPDPDQLKKAYLAFQKLPDEIVCLQAKLNYYNPRQNLLTKLFTAEYSLWFDMVLPGLQSINTTIPLGGTSNHLKVTALKQIKGWDPFNVTEDCDLGVRLFSLGFKTAIIDSVTLEEANSQVKNWLRQRSRWVKGYMQTYLVHNRRPLQFIKNHGLHALIFQLVIGARVSFLLINPILWLTLISYFTLYNLVGPAIESFYLSPAFYMAVSAFVFGNFLYLYSYMIGCAKKGQWDLIKYVFFVPFYWFLASCSAVVALYQLLFKPYYWEKTIHGLHLGSQKSTPTQNIIPKVSLREKIEELITKRKAYLGGGLLVGAFAVANFINFVFNSYLGRVLEFHDFALIGLMGGFLSFSSILFGAFSNAINYKSGFLIGKYGDTSAYYFWKYFRKKSVYVSLAFTLIWFILTPFLTKYFAPNNIYVFALFGIILLLGLTNSADRGFLSSRLMFGSLAAVYFLEPVIKLLIAAVLVYFGLKFWAISAIPLAATGTFFLGWFFINLLPKPQTINIPQDKIKKFPYKFFAASMLTGFSSIAFLTVDIILANHFLNPTQAGQYTLLSLVGKMVYFLGGLSSSFIIPVISRNEGANKNSTKALYTILFSTLGLLLIGFVSFGVFGYITIPALYGHKALAIVPYLWFFTAGMVCYSISRVILNYYLVKKVYTFAVLTSLLIVLQVLLISLFNNSLKAIAIDMVVVWVIHLALTVSLHLKKNSVKAFESNLKEVWRLFVTSQNKHPFENTANQKLNILIFNWRDIKHKWAGGAEVYIHELAKRWVQDGNKVTLFCGNSSDKPEEEQIDGIQIYRKGGFYTVYIWAFLYYMFKFRGKYHIIVDSENGIPFFTPLYASEKKLLLIHHVHQEVFRKNLIKPLAFLASFLEMKVMPLLYRRVQIITVSPSSKEEILKNNLSQVEPKIIYNGLDKKKFIPGEKFKVPLIAYIGRLQNYKSLDILLRAAHQVLKTFPNAEFVIAGDGQARKELETIAKDLNIANKIYFTGKVTEEEKIQLFQKAWAYVNPSFIEGWGIATIEANSCGTPAVASNVCGLRDSVKNPHTGFLFPYANVKRLSEIIVELIKNNKLRTKLSANAIKWANHFSWDKSARQSLALIKKSYEQ